LMFSLVGPVEARRQLCFLAEGYVIDRISGALLLQPFPVARDRFAPTKFEHGELEVIHALLDFAVAIGPDQRIGGVLLGELPYPALCHVHLMLGLAYHDVAP